MPNLTVPAAALGLPSLSSANPSSSNTSTTGDPLLTADHDAPIVRHGLPGCLPPRTIAKARRIVIFRMDDQGPEQSPRVTAVFPCEPAEDGLMLGFTREEGHMPCSRLWFDLSRPAKPEDFGPLADYLKAKGNVLDIRHRLTPAMETTRSREWEGEKAKATAAAERPNEALLACLHAAGITSVVTGVDRERIILEGHQTAKAQPARWIAMYLAKNSFNVSVREIAWAYGRSVSGVERLIRRVEDMKRTNGTLAAMIERMRGMAESGLEVAA